MNQKNTKFLIKKKLLIVVNVDRFFLSHRLPIALAAQKEGYEVHIATALTLPIETLNQYGFVVHSLSLDRSKSNILSLGYELFELLLIFKKVRPNIVHLVTIKPVLLGGIAARILKIPALVVAVSGLGFTFLQTGVKAKFGRFFIGLLYRLALKHSNATIIFQNSDDLILMQHYTRLKKESTELIPGSGIDLNVYQYHQLLATCPIVLLASRLLIDKGVREFIEAARIIGKETKVRFVLAGDIDHGNPASLNRLEVENWVDEGIIEWWGHCDDMPTVLLKSHIVVLPSYREGFPKILIEAAACGRPVITTDVPGCRDAIIVNETGLLVPKGDVSALAKAILTLLNNPELCKHMGKAARQFAESNFDISQVVDRHLKIYKRLLN